MGRISHSNIKDNHKAYERVRNHGLSIVEHRWRDHAAKRDVESLTVFSEFDMPLTFGRFSDWDEEVRLNAQTSWLNKLADELDYWQSKS